MKSVSENWPQENTDIVITPKTRIIGLSLVLTKTLTPDFRSHVLTASHILIADLLDRVSNIVDRDLDTLTSTDLCNLLLYGNSQFRFDKNHSMTESTITFIKSTRRFEQI